MYGKNEVSSPDQQSDGSLNVNSWFYTIQGEGPDGGTPAVFLRLAKCNLRCWFCDTEFEKGSRVDAKTLALEIILECKRWHCTLVVITGGEPLLQNIIPLVEVLNKANIQVSVETAGTVWLEGIQDYFAPTRDWKGNLIVVSPKTPKLCDKLMPYIGALKYVVRAGEMDHEDGLPIMSTQLPGEPARIYRPSLILKTTIPIYLQPCDEQSIVENTENKAAAAKACMKFGYRLSLQMHKIVGVP